MDCCWFYHYKTLEIQPNKECPICLDEDIECVKYLNCSHFVCIPCYKKQVYPKKLERTGEPEFPYGSDVEDRYYDDQDNPIWSRDYPLIDQYNEEFAEWEDEWDRRANELTSYQCPICREPVFRDIHLKSGH